jgi:hypothetical protein
LIRQVQQAKEEEIEQLENRAEFLIKEIGDYKKEITEKYLNNKELKSKLTQRLNNLQNAPATVASASFSSSNKLEDLDFKLKYEKNLIQKSIFDGAFMKFEKNEPELAEDTRSFFKLEKFPNKKLIGNLKIEDTNIINADFDLVKAGSLNFSDTEINRQISKRVYHRYFSTGECFLAFETNSRSTFDFFILNKDKTVKKMKKNIKAFGTDYFDVFYLVNDKLAFQADDGQVVVYDNSLELLNKYKNFWRLNPLSDSDLEEESDGSMTLKQYRLAVNKLESKNILIGACESGLYFANEEDHSLIELCDWSFKYLKDLKFKVNIGSSYEIKLFRKHEDKYYFIDDSFSLNIIKMSNNFCKTIEKVRRYEIDGYGNLIVFRDSNAYDTEIKLNKGEEIERSIGFYDLNGEHKYDLKLVNFHKNLNENDFEYFDDFEQAIFDYWIQATDIDKCADNVLSFFDKETFTFQHIVFDDFVSSKISVK